MTEQELYNEYRKSDCKSFTDFLVNKITELKDELNKWKNEWQEQVQKANDEGYARTLQTIQLSKAKELLKRAQSYTENLDDEADKLYDEIEQFLKDETETEQKEPYYVIVNMNCQYEICRKCPKSGLFKGTYEECEKWIKEKLRKVEK